MKYNVQESAAIKATFITSEVSSSFCQPIGASLAFYTLNVKVAFWCFEKVVSITKAVEAESREGD